MCQFTSTFDKSRSENDFKFPVSSISWVEGVMSVLFNMVVFLSIETMPISPWIHTPFSITF